MFFQLVAKSLDELAVHIERRDQTLSHYGFGQDEMRSFVALLNGRGINRIVPIGNALMFNRIWDGNDLLQAFTRKVTIDGRKLYVL